MKTKTKTAIKYLSAFLLTALCYALMLLAETSFMFLAGFITVLVIWCVHLIALSAGKKKGGGNEE